MSSFRLDKMIAALTQSTDSSHRFQHRVSKVRAAKIRALWVGIRQKSQEALRGKVARVCQTPAEQTLVLGAARRMLWADYCHKGLKAAKAESRFSWQNSATFRKT